MLWQYTFGRKGQKGYSQASKLLTLVPESETMHSQWTNERLAIFSTSGLREFVQTGYGTFSATEAFERGAPWSKKHVADRLTFDLQPSHLTYRWEVTTNGNTEPYSEFELDRATAPATASTQSN